MISKDDEDSNNPYPIHKGMITNNSFDSIPEITNNRSCIKTYFLILIILIAINGIFILIYQKKYFSPVLLFPHMTLLIILVYLYSFAVISALIASSIISSLIYGLIICVSTIRKKRIPLKDNEEKANEDGSDYYLKEEHISYVGYLFGVFVVLVIILYLSAIPLSIYLIVSMTNNSLMKNIKVYYIVYVFLALNCFVGLSLLGFGSLRLIFGKVTASIRKTELDVDEDYINEIRKEIKNTIKQDSDNFNSKDNQKEIIV